MAVLSVNNDRIVRQPKGVDADVEYRHNEAPCEQVADAFAQHLGIPGAYVASRQRFPGIGEAVHQVREQREKLH